MNSDSIIKMAFELGNALASSEEIAALQDSQNKVAQDQVAYAIIMRYQEARSQMENKLRDGLQIGPLEEDNLKKLEQDLKGNPILKELMSAQECFDNLMQAVYFAMNQALSGGCSAGCESCGGGCGM